MKVVVLVLLLVSSVGCCGTLSRETAFHDGVKQYAVESGMLAEYEAYVEADTKIKPETKVIRKGTSKGLRALIAEEGKALKD
jgi:hypothetical protein